MTGTTAPLPAFEFLRMIPRDLIHVDEIPLFTPSEPFPWEKLTSYLKEQFQLADLIIKQDVFQWRSKEDLFSGMSDNLVPLRFSIPKLEGELYWVMSDDDITQLMSLLLIRKAEPVRVLEPQYKEGFYRFLAIEVIHAFTKIGAQLIPQLQKESTLPQAVMLSLDISITTANKALTGRLFISPEMRAAVKKFASQTSTQNLLHSPMASKLDLIVHLEIARTTVPFKDWKNIHPGDFLVLDSYDMDPEEEDKKGVMLTIDGIPFYRGKIKENNIKIVEHPLYYEVDKTMERKFGEEPGEEEGFEEEESEIEDFEEEFTDEELEDEHFDDGTDLEEHQESLVENEAREHPSEPAAEESEPAVEKSETPETVVKGAKLVDEKKEKEETPKSPAELPLTVVVEIGRLQMKVQKLLELQPGNLLELDVHPERGVDLVVNGKRVAKGELLRIGDVLGVRILEL